MIPVLDISHWKYPVDFRQVKAAGFNFCIAKPTEAESLTDTRYAGYVRDMNAAGIIDGSYHYFRV